MEVGCGACRDNTAIFPFTMAFQPVMDLDLCRIDAYEALVRGPSGEGAGHVLGQVNATNRYAFDQSCRVRAIELAAGLGIDRQLNINFLPNAVYEPAACIRVTLEAAARTGFPLDHITFEIVEQEDIAEPEKLASIIAEYKRRGFKVALDDFATGYSGLSRLADLKPDIVKLDRALVSHCDEIPTRLAIARSMVALCQEVGMKLVIEGVERAAEVVALRRIGVRYMQGFFFAKPAFEAIVRDHDIDWTLA